ncbi:MAG: GerMN domain-containing protein [Clostridiaceae bacterium]
MKKIIFSILLIIVFIFISGCSGKTNTEKTNVKQNPNNTNNVETKTVKIESFYPFLSNVKYSFQGEGNEYASYTQYVDYMQGNKIQLRTNNGGTETVNILEIKNGQLTLVYSVNECYYRENFINKAANKNEVLLKEPLKKGTAWTLSDGAKRTITNMEAEIAAVSLTYKCIEVTTEYKDSTRKDYYAENIGLVKTVSESKDYKVSSTLMKMDKNVQFTQTVKFYYPNINDDKIHMIEQVIKFNTNDITRKKFENYFKKSPNSLLGKLISADTSLNSLYLNKDGRVYADFSKQLVSEMNAGSVFEAMILQSITNTLGNYYNVKQVYITVEENPYSSGHIYMKKGEAFTVKSE